VKDEFAKLVEKFALQGFSEEVADHLFSGTILNREFTGVDAVGDEIETTVEVFSLFAAGPATIHFEENHTLVVLKEYSILMTVTLRFKKVIGPENDWHEIIGSDEFSSSGTVGIDLLLGGGVDWHTFAKRHTATRVPTHVRVRGVRSVNPPFGNGDGVSAEN
jgi:hypothetical protein